MSVFYFISFPSLTSYRRCRKRRKKLNRFFGFEWNDTKLYLKCDNWRVRHVLSYVLQNVPVFLLLFIELTLKLCRRFCFISAPNKLSITFRYPNIWMCKWRHVKKCHVSHLSSSSNHLKFNQLSDCNQTIIVNSNPLWIWA